MVQAGQRNREALALEGERDRPVALLGALGRRLAAGVEDGPGDLREEAVEERVRLVERKVVGRGVEQERGVGAEGEDLARALVDLRDAERAVAAQDGARARGAGPVEAGRAVHDRRGEAGAGEQVAEDRGRRRLAAGAGDGDEPLAREQRGEFVRAARDGDAEAARGGEVGVVVLDRDGGDDARRGGGDAGAVLREERDALRAERGEGGDGLLGVEEPVGSGDGLARVEEGLGEGGHAGAGDADEVDGALQGAGEGRTECARVYRIARPRTSAPARVLPVAPLFW